MHARLRLALGVVMVAGIIIAALGVPWLAGSFLKAHGCAISVGPRDGEFSRNAAVWVAGLILVLLCSFFFFIVLVSVRGLSDSGFVRKLAERIARWLPKETVPLSELVRRTQRGGPDRVSRMIEGKRLTP